MKVHVDFETRSRLDVTRVGSFRYAEDPTTDIIIFGYAINDNPIVVIDDWDDPRLNAIRDAVGQATFAAHNAQFERAVWRHCLTKRRGWPEPKRTAWDCTAARAAARGYPRWLEGAASALRLKVNKDPDGKKLIKLFSMPDGKTGTFKTKADSPEAWTRFLQYNNRDIEVERELDRALPELPPFERQAYLLDALMNEAGFPIDVELVRTAVSVVEVLDERLRARGRHLTNGINPTQRDMILGWLAEEGIELETLQAQGVRDLLKDDALPDHVREVLQIRLEGSRAGVKKLNAMLDTVCSDGRVHGGFMYYGANTGRASGRLVQPHNFPRGDPNIVQDDFLDVLSLGDPDVLELMYPRPLQTLSGAMRGFIAAPRGKRFLVADYSAIEARVLAWVAGQADMLARYRAGVDNYIAQASELFGVRPEDVTSEQRRIGKNLVLGCGYQMSGKRFPEFCKTQGVTVSAAFGEEAVRKYRESVPSIVKLWADTERAAVAAVHGERRVELRHFSFLYQSGTLYAELPSGRSIVYPEAHLEQIEGMYGVKSAVVYSREFSGRWVNESTYGGKLVENVVQGIARDLMVLGTLSAYRAGYTVIATVHDELIAEVAVDDPRTPEEFASVICQLPGWAQGLPLEASGYTSARYKKG